MHVEVSVALEFIASYLYSKLPRRRVDLFAEELERGLKAKFAGHWYPGQPAKGSGYRCVRIGEKIDPLITSAIELSGLELGEIRAFLPVDLTVWIDPNEVSHRLGERGPVKVLYSQRDVEDEVADREIVQTVSNSAARPVTIPFSAGFTVPSSVFNPDAQSFRPIEALSASLTNLSLSPSSQGGIPAWRSACASPIGAVQTGCSSPAGFPQQTATRLPTTFTAASFAQTKFGSTKLKSQSKRPSRLSPTEFGGYPKQQGVQPQQQRSPGGAVTPGAWSNGGTMSPARPQSLSPRDPRVDFIGHQHQQRMLHYQQQQQQQQHLALQNAGLLAGGLTGSLNDLHHSQQQEQQHNFAALLAYGSVQPQLPPLGGAPVAAVVTPPNGAASYLDVSSANWNTMPPYASLQHMLVAN